MSDLRIRRGRERDTASICRVHRASITALCSRHYTPEQIEAWAGPKKPEDYEKPIRELIVLVAERGNDVIGLSILNPEAGEIHALYIHPEHIRRGVGSALLRETEAEARSGGLSRLSLNATLNAVTFYEARGFASLGEATNTLRVGVDLPCVRMEKRLPAGPS